MSTKDKVKDTRANTRASEDDSGTSEAQLDSTLTPKDTRANTRASEDDSGTSEAQLDSTLTPN